MFNKKIVLLSLAFALASQVASADTYNFYFDKKKKASAESESPPPEAPQAPSPAVTQAPAPKSDEIVIPKRRWGLFAMDARGYDYGYSVGLLAFGYRFNSYFGSLAYISPGTSNGLHVGADAELIPLRFPVKNFNLIEVGLIAGASTIGPYGPSGLAPHLGVRFSLNTGPSVTLTLGIRARPQATMTDFGFTVNI